MTAPTFVFKLGVWKQRLRNNFFKTDVAVLFPEA
jgi:hypothetical protein